jgi:hypothetical protein
MKEIFLLIEKETSKVIYLILAGLLADFLLHILLAASKNGISI